MTASPLKTGRRGQPAFFQLGPGVFGGMPFRHADALAVTTYTGINRSRSTDSVRYLFSYWDWTISSISWCTGLRVLTYVTEPEPRFEE